MRKNPFSKVRKYRNKKTVIDGITFDSIKESKVYQDLKLQRDNGIIYDFMWHVKFPLIEKCKGTIRNYREKYYEADFVIYDKDDKILKIIDVKPTLKKGAKNSLSRTAKYQMSIHMLFVKYGYEVTEV